MGTSDMLQSTSKVAHISSLLNLETTIVKRIERYHFGLSPGDTKKQFRDHESSDIATNVEDNCALVIKDSIVLEWWSWCNFVQKTLSLNPSFEMDKLSSLNNVDLVTLKLFSNTNMVNPSGTTTISLQEEVLLVS